MDYTSTLETLESFSNPLSMSSAHRVRAWMILHPLVKVSIPGIAHCSQQGALFTLGQLLSMP